MVNETGKTGALAGRLPLAVAIIALAVALFAAISVQPAQTAGASAQQIAAGTTAAPNDAFDRAMQAGRITACYVVWPPSVIKDPNSGNLSGFVIDMFSNMASSANLNVTYVESTFGGFPADLNTGKCDVVVAGIYPLISRSTSVAFTNPFLFSGNSMVVRAGDDRFNTTDSFNQKGVRIAVVSGEFGDLYAEKYFPNADLVVLDASSDPSMPLAAVSSGQADVGISEADVVGQYAAIHPEVKNLYPDQPFATEPVSFAVRQGDQKLLNFLNNGIEYLHATGFTEAAVRSYNASYWYEEQTQYAEIK